ncbi:MAG: phosphopantetheine adenylyltransferase [Candidatus Bathyarchaeota archaeon]|nr:phosphopantetheine adenylyltransferase [Candidatus Bathyarchaeota archaeon]MDH5786790.1 phosphopantetheine adenylyltransferase [Candidatus Bathyarchaeota archaeon]
MNKKFKAVAVGGTFDEFHKGHRILLMKAFEVGEKVLVGLSSDKFAEKLRRQKNHFIECYEKRLAELKEFLRQNGFLERAEIITLDDPYGITLSHGCLNALVVSRETEYMAQEINKQREKKGLKPLKIIIVEMVPAENCFPISTTRIRRGEIDREGHLLKMLVN